MESKEMAQMVQVTKFQRSAEALESWLDFCNGKSVETEVRKAPKDGYNYPRFSLWRSLTKEELAGIKSGKYIVLNNFLEYNPLTKNNNGSTGRKCWGWGGTHTRKAKR